MRFVPGIFVFLCMGLFSLSGCSPAKEGPKRCATIADCGQGERCIRQACKKIEVEDEAPTAVIKEQQEEHRIRQKSSFELDGSRSYDPEGQTLTYEWTFLEKPEKSKGVIEKSKEAKASFVADAPGIFIAQLVVIDTKQNKSRPARIKIQVYGLDENGDPIANAGTDQIVATKKEVKVDGSNSSDPDGDPLTYEWQLKSKPTGSTAQLSDSKGKSATFKTDLPGKYIVQLIVDDGLEKSSPDTVTIEALADYHFEPKLTKVTPDNGFVDSTVAITLTGEQFSQRANVIFDGLALDSKYVKYISDKELKIQLPLQGKSPKDYELKARNPNGKESNGLTFKANPLPSPKLTKLSPNFAAEGSKLEVTVTGSGFIPKTEILFQAVPLLTTYKSPTEVKVKLDLSQTLPGKYKMQARNPGNRSSDPMDFTVVQPGPPPVLKVLNPPFGKTGSKIQFSIHGVGFSPNAVILFDGQPIPSKRIRRDEIDADPVLDLTNVKPGKYPVVARNQDGQKSKPQMFVVEHIEPVPQISRILPFFVYLNSTSKLGVYGTGFDKTSELILGSHTIKAPAVRYRSTTFLEVTVDTTKGTWTPGDVMAKIKNASGKTSNGFKVTVAHRVPLISSVTPSGWVNKCDIRVNIFGSNFLKSSKVYFGRVLYTTTHATNKLTFHSTKHLSFQLSGKTTSVGYHDIYVDNGPSAQSTKVRFQMQNATSIPVPQIREIRPTAGSSDTQVSAILYNSGTNYFSNGAIVYLNGKAQATTCGSTGTRCYTLGAKLDLTGLKPGTYPLTVRNPCGAPSKSISFLVTEAPKPFIGQISPSYAYPGDKKTLTINGANFSKRAQLLWGGRPVAVTYQSEKQLITTAPVDFTGAKVGAVNVEVDNGGNNKSKAVQFSILAKNHPLRIDSTSTKEFERLKVHNNISVVGAGFTSTTEFYFNGKKVTAKFSIATLVTISGLDFTKLAAGTYYLYAKNGNQQSNLFPLFAKPFPPPVINYLNPAVLYPGQTSTLYIYASRICSQIINRYYCKQNPKVTITGPKGKDYSSNFRTSRSFVLGGTSYVYGTLNLSNMAVGAYKIYLTLPTGERSNPALLNVLPIPDPIITRFLPTFGFAGTKFPITIYGAHFCPTVSTRCSQYPKINITSGGLVNHGASLRLTYSYTGSPTSSYVRGDFDATKLQPGLYSFQFVHPTSGKKSKIVKFSLRKEQPPYINYTSPYYHTVGSTRTISIYGNYFTRSSQVYLGTQKLTTYPTTSTTYVRASFPSSLKAGVYELTVRNSAKMISPLYGFRVVSNSNTNPIITRFSSSNGIFFEGMFGGTIYVYGLRWPKMTTSTLVNFTVDGKPLKSSRPRCYTTSSQPYCFLSNPDFRGLKVGKHTVAFRTVIGGKTYQSAAHPFAIAKAPPPEIRNLSPTSTTMGSTRFRVTVFGNYFQRGAVVRIGLVNYTATYVNPTYIYLYIDTKKLGKGNHSFVVVNPNKEASNAMSFTIQ